MSLLTGLHWLASRSSSPSTAEASCSFLLQLQRAVETRRIRGFPDFFLSNCLPPFLRKKVLIWASYSKQQLIPFFIMKVLYMICLLLFLQKLVSWMTWKSKQLISGLDQNSVIPWMTSKTDTDWTTSSQCKDILFLQRQIPVEHLLRYLHDANLRGERQECTVIWCSKLAI